MVSLLHMKNNFLDPTLVATLYRTHPLFIAQDQLFGYVFDNWMMFAVKCYYWPAFIAGASDNIVDLFKPQTYSICRV